MKITQTYITLAALAAMAAGITSAYADTLKVSYNPDCRVGVAGSHGRIYL